MSRTRKEGKRSKRIPAGKPESPEIMGTIMDRRTFGSTEKILRRNRKVWTRLTNKLRRRLDKEAVMLTR